MRYSITLQVNGKVSNFVWIGNDPICYLSGYLQAMLDDIELYNNEVILDDVAIKRLKN